MKTAVLLTGISAATLLFAPSGFAQYTAAEATTTISAAETVNQSQQAPARDPRFTSRYGNAGAARTAQPAAPVGTGRATQLATPAVAAQAPQPAAPARDPRFTSRYGNAGAARTAPPAAQQVGGPQQQPMIATPPSAPQPAAPARDPRFTSRYGNAGAARTAPPAAQQVGGAQQQQQPAVATPVVVIPQRTADPEREQRIVDFQRQKAISGNPTSQYDLGMRYLKGDGVEQDREQALRWLKMSNQGGNSRAAKQLELIAREPAPKKVAAPKPAPPKSE